MLTATKSRKIGGGPDANSPRTDAIEAFKRSFDPGDIPASVKEDTDSFIEITTEDMMKSIPGGSRTGSTDSSAQAAGSPSENMGECEYCGMSIDLESDDDVVEDNGKYFCSIGCLNDWVEEGDDL